MKKNLLLFLVIFTTFILISRGCSASPETMTSMSENDIGLATQKTEYAYGKEVRLNFQNNLAETLTIENDCTSEPLDVYKYKNGEWELMTASYDIECISADILIAPGEKTLLSYSTWTYSLFDELGRYQIRYTLDEDTTFYSNEFTITEPSLITKLWREGLHKPIYNALIWLTSVLPGHSLAFAIILITLLIRTILLVPSQQAMRSQRRLQDIQPKIEEIKRKYEGNQEKIAAETMKIWQENKVNPLGSCLPLLVQFPILIALFYTIKDGLNPDKVTLLYEFQKDFSLALINPKFFIFDLTKIDIYFFPIAVGLLQFTQMKLAFQRKKKKKQEPKKKTNKPAKKGKGQDMAADMEKANKMMAYFMPIMIAFFTASIPSGVGLYWGTSTLYGIIQQIVVNREKPKSKSTATVKVIDKN